MVDKQIVLEDSSGDKKYFTMFPNMLYEIGLTPYDRDLYTFYKKVAGENGMCWIDLREIKKQTKISPAQISKSRKILMEKGLISCFKKKVNGEGWPAWHISINDIWEENIKTCKDEYAKRSEDAMKCSLRKKVDDNKSDKILQENCLPRKQIGLPRKQIGLQTDILIRSKDNNINNGNISNAKNALEIAQEAQSPLDVSAKEVSSSKNLSQSGFSEVSSSETISTAISLSAVSSETISMAVLPKKKRGRKVNSNKIEMPKTEEVTHKYLAILGKKQSDMSLSDFRRLQGKIRDLMGFEKGGKPNGCKAYTDEQILGCTKELVRCDTPAHIERVTNLLELYIDPNAEFPPDWTHPKLTRQTAQKAEKNRRDLDLKEYAERIGAMKPSLV
jgi:hypothetical protein